MIRRQRPFCVPFLNYVDPVKTQSTCRKVTVVTEEYVKVTRNSATTDALLCQWRSCQLLHNCVNIPDLKP